MEKMTAILKKLENDLGIDSYVLRSCFITLDNNHQAFDYFLKSKNEDFITGQRVLRLYGLLQSLFVCIDALYTLSYKITFSKNFININDNKTLRELKYIRNDVVGHPTNRIVDDHEEYAVLKGEDITNDGFSYHIYYEDKDTKKEVVYQELLDAYYNEAYEFLDAMDSYVTSLKTPYLLDDVVEIYNSFIEGRDIRTHLSLFKKKNNVDSRSTKKVNLITRLFKDYLNESSSTLRYIISYQICKLAEYVSIKEDVKSILHLIRMPNNLNKVFTFFDENPSYIHLLSNVYDYNHPLFYISVERIIKQAKRVKNTAVIEYFSKIKEFSQKKDRDYVYAYGAILKEYKGNKPKKN